MPIPVTCQCGARFAAKDEMAGMRAKCPKCQAVLTVPQAAAAPEPAGNSLMAGLLDEVGLFASKTGVRCPSCHKDMKQGAIICLNCGFNTQTGKKLETKVEVSAPKPLPSERRDRRQRDSDWPAELPYNLTWAKLGIGVGGYVALCIVIALISRSAAGVMLGVPGLIGMLYAGITVLIMAFQESFVLGLLYLVCDLYKIYFVVTNFNDLKAAVGVFGIGWLLLVVGSILISTA